MVRCLGTVGVTSTLTSTQRIENFPEVHLVKGGFRGGEVHTGENPVISGGRPSRCILGTGLQRAVKPAEISQMDIGPLRAGRFRSVGSPTFGARPSCSPILRVDADSLTLTGEPAS